MMLRAWIGTLLGVSTVKAIRGAISVPSDEPSAIREAVLELLHELRITNQLDDREIVSAIFTVTPDLVSAFPAEAARVAGWQDVPLLCTTEIPVAAGLPRCLRVMLHVQRPWGATRPRHAYLRDAARLRPDLVSGLPSGAQQANIPATRSTRRPVGALACPNPPLSSVPSSPMSSRP
jgi:chorismate mutase